MRKEKDNNHDAKHDSYGTDDPLCEEGEEFSKVNQFANMCRYLLSLLDIVHRVVKHEVASARSCWIRDHTCNVICINRDKLWNI